MSRTKARSVPAEPLEVTDPNERALLERFRADRQTYERHLKAAEEARKLLESQFKISLNGAEQKTPAETAAPLRRRRRRVRFADQSGHTYGAFRDLIVPVINTIATSTKRFTVVEVVAAAATAGVTINQLSRRWLSHVLSQAPGLKKVGAKRFANLPGPALNVYSLKRGVEKAV